MGLQLFTIVGSGAGRAARRFDPQVWLIRVLVVVSLSVSLAISCWLRSARAEGSSTETIHFQAAM